MNDINIVLPIKDPTHAKERLAPLLSPEQRRELALLLIEQTLAFFASLAPVAHRLVVTDSEWVAECAKQQGFAVLRETSADGETAAVERATRWSVEHGFRSQLVIPGDMAELDADDILRLLAQERPDPSVILCPASGDDGTNAILTTPPDAISFRFGDRSFPDYMAQARRKGMACSVLRLESLVLDLDTPDDVRVLLRNGHNVRLTSVLKEWNILQKL